LFPDVRSGELDGTCLLFNMERLFEAFLGAKLQKAWQSTREGNYLAVLQGPTRSLAQSEVDHAFRLRPDITVLDDSRVVVRIFDAKWKLLDPKASSFGVSPSDVYQLAAYASRYSCERVALVYPASVACPAGLVQSYRLAIPGAPILEVHAVDIRDLARNGSLPLELRPPLRADRKSDQRMPEAIA
jgi:5-methylcytosine-specific restriction enzyme subunit McrC